MEHPTMAEPARLGQLQDATLDHLLSSWHHWQLADRGGTGFPKKALLVGDTRAIRAQYDGHRERLDDELDARIHRQIDHEVREMHEPHRSAVYVLARNLWSGVAVWDSPRLPWDKAERAEVIRQARQILTKRLLLSGVIHCTNDDLRAA